MNIEPVATDAVVAVISIILSLAVIGLVALLVLSRRQAATPTESADPEVTRRLDELHRAFAGRDGALGAQVAQIDAKLAQLQASVTGREAALDEQVRGIGAQMTGITALFTHDRARGGWAEIGMKRIFELGGLSEGRDYTCQITYGSIRPDAVVHLPGDRKIVIDAKFPVSHFQAALAEEDRDRREKLLADQGKELERVGKDLAAKGYLDLASGGYVVMYLPSQAVYEAAASAHPELIERLMGKRVIVAGPSALFALLVNVASLLTEYRALQQADQILDDARELHRRLDSFAGHLRKLGAGLAGTVRTFNAVVGSWEGKVEPQLRRMSEQSGGADIGAPDHIEEPLREMSETGLRVAG
jgi:DNA recombination protein RmuC